MDILGLRVSILLRTGFHQVRTGILSLLRMGILHLRVGILLRTGGKVLGSWFVYIFHHTAQILELYHTYHSCEIEDIYFSSQNSQNRMSMTILVCQ